MNNISFKGRTNIMLDPVIYDNIVNRQSKRGFTNLNLSLSKNYNIRNATNITFNPNETTEPAVLLLNEQGGIFVHNAGSKIDDIIHYIQKLKRDAKDKLTAWIIGGHMSDATTRKVNTLAEILCDKPDIDTSIIAGQKSVAPNIMMRAYAKKLNMTLDLNETRNSVPDLENYFDIVELNNTEFIS